MPAAVPITFRICEVATVTAHACCSAILQNAEARKIGADKLEKVCQPPTARKSTLALTAGD